MSVSIDDLASAVRELITEIRAREQRQAKELETQLTALGGRIEASLGRLATAIATDVGTLAQRTDTAAQRLQDVLDESRVHTQALKRLEITLTQEAIDMHAWRERHEALPADEAHVGLSRAAE